MDLEVIEIGTVRRAHGVRGWLRVQLHDLASPALQYARHLLVGGQGAVRRFALRKVRDLGGGTYLICLDGIADRDQADALRGQPLSVLRAELPPLGADEFYLRDLLGCQVLTRDGTLAGVVQAVPRIGAEDMLELARPGRAEALVPLRFLSALDLEARRLEIDPPEGLLDLDVPDPPAAEGGSWPSSSTS